MEINKIKKIIKDPGVLLEVLNKKSYLSWIPDKLFLKWQFKRRMNKN